MADRRLRLRRDSRLILDIPENVLALVINEYLDTADIARLAHTNRQLRAAALDPVLWKNFRVMLSSDGDRWVASLYKTLSRVAKTVESLKLDVQLEFDFSKFPVLPSLKNLDISGNEEWLNLVQFKNLSRKLPSVTSLKFEYSGPGSGVFTEPRKAGYFCQTIDEAWAPQLVHLDLRLSRCAIRFGLSQVNATILQDLISHLVAPMETLMLPGSFTTRINSAALTPVIQRSQDSLKSFGEHDGLGSSFEVTGEFLAALSHCSKLTELRFIKTGYFDVNVGRELIDCLGSLATLRHLELGVDVTAYHQEWNALWQNPPFSLEYLSLDGTICPNTDWTTLIHLQLPSLRFLSLPDYVKRDFYWAIYNHPIDTTPLPLKTLQLSKFAFTAEGMFHSRTAPSLFEWTLVYLHGRFTQKDISFMFFRFHALECVQVRRGPRHFMNYLPILADLVRLLPNYVVRDTGKMYSITKM